MTGRIALTGLRVRGRHGVFDFEREQGQRFVIDVVLGIDTRDAAAGDALAATVDYGELALRIRAAVESDPVDLIETVAARIAGVCLLPGTVQWTRVTVHKPDAPIQTPFTDVTLTITRYREDQRD